MTNGEARKRELRGMSFEDGERALQPASGPAPVQMSGGPAPAAATGTSWMDKKLADYQGPSGEELIATAQGTPVAMRGSNGAAATVDALTAQIGGERDQARQDLQTVIAEREPLLDAIDAAKAHPPADPVKAEADLKAMEDRRKELEAREAALTSTIEKAQTDLDAVANPGTPVATLQTIAARRGTGSGQSGAQSETFTFGKEEKKAMGGAGGPDTTVTTTSEQVGGATGTTTTSREDSLTKRVDSTTTSLTRGDLTETTGSSTTTGLVDGGVGRKKTESQETKVGDDSVSHATSSSTTLGAGGLTHATSESHSSTTGGKTESSETSNAWQVGPGGVSNTKTASVTNADGSGTSQSTSQGVERGKGKVGVTSSSSNTETAADGSSTENKRDVKAGVKTGKDGVGAYGQTDLEKTHTTAGGLKVGAVAGLSGNVGCNIAVEPGTNPPKYRISMTISCGGSVGAKASKGKDAHLGGNAKVAASGTFSRSYLLPEAEAAAYVERLKAANGGSASGPERELAIIATGVSGGWDKAAAMIDGVEAAVGDPDAQAGMQEGEKVDLSAQVTASGGVDAGVGGFGVTAGVEHTSDIDFSVEKKDGKLVYDKKVGDKDGYNLGGSVKEGVVGGGVGYGAYQKSAHGYTIVLDPKAADFKQLQAELSAAKSQAALDAFAKAHPQYVTATTVTTGHGNNVSGNVGIGPVSLEMGGSGSFEETETTDKDGKKTKHVVGQNSDNASLGAGDYKIGTSTTETAVADVDAEGHATLDAFTTKTDTNAEKWLTANVPGMADKQDQSTLAKVAGAKEDADTDEVHIAGIRAKDSDIGGIIYTARDLSAWMKCCPDPSYIDEWRATWRAVRRAGDDHGAVAGALAKFVGKMGGGKQAIVESLVRGDSGLGGNKYEFPEGLGDLKAEYTAVASDDPGPNLEKLFKDQGQGPAVEAAQALVASCDSLKARFLTSREKFEDKAAFGEMLNAVQQRKESLLGRIRVWKGGKADDLSKDEWIDRYNGLLENCMADKDQETVLFDRIAATFDSDGKQGLSGCAEATPMVNELDALYLQWDPKYAEMARIAQEHDFGKNVYWNYKPDRARYRVARAGKPPGPPSAAKPETHDYRKKDPGPKGVEYDPAKLKKENEQLFKSDADRTRAAIPQAKNMANGARMRLQAWIHDHFVAGAQDAWDQGEASLGFAGREEGRMGKDTSDGAMQTWGVSIANAYQQAAQHFQTGLALYPKGNGGWPAPK
ncbi:MAG: hypothetical protein U1F43_32595 [Myxococcota bacterium]